MSYVVAGYTVVLGILFLYAVQLLWRRRRLVREAATLEARRLGPIRGAADGGIAGASGAGASVAGSAGTPAESR